MGITGPRPDGGLNTHVLMLLVSGSTKSREISLICSISYTIRGLFGQRVVTRREAGMILVMIWKSDKPFLFLFVLCVSFFCFVLFFDPLRGDHPRTLDMSLDLSDLKVSTENDLIIDSGVCYILWMPDMRRSLNLREQYEAKLPLFLTS